MSFQDKVVIVTGGSSGIGAATAVKFAEEGAKVAIVGRNKHKLDNVAKKCGNSLVIVADVCKDADVKRIVSETLSKFGQLDILINNAGIAKSVSIEANDTMAVFDQTMSTKYLRSIVYLTHLAVPHLLKTKGNIVNTSSVAALRSVAKNYFPYDTSKAALDNFSRSVAQELGSSGVRVNCVNPGPVRTDFLVNAGAPKNMEEAIFKHMQQLTALNRISDPEELADLVLFLASDKSKAITGSSFVSDNGILLKVIDTPAR